MPTTAKKTKITKVQRLHLDLIRLASFNDFNGPRIVDELIAHRDLWLACVMDRDAYGFAIQYHEEQAGTSKRPADALPLAAIDTIKVRDIADGYWGVDALYIMPAPGKEDALELLVRRSWFADEIDWRDGYHACEKILRVWWD